MGARVKVAAAVALPAPQRSERGALHACMPRSCSRGAAAPGLLCLGQPRHAAQPANGQPGRGPAHLVGASRRRKKRSIDGNEQRLHRQRARQQRGQQACLRGGSGCRGGPCVVGGRGAARHELQAAAGPLGHAHLVSTAGGLGPHAAGGRPRGGHIGGGQPLRGGAQRHGGGLNELDQSSGVFGELGRQEEGICRR